MKKHCLVTGGAGFIGSHSVDLLIQKGWKVTVFDNLSTGSRKNLNRKARFIKGDLASIDAHASRLRGVTHILHCAAQISVNESVRNPANDAKQNILGSVKLLELAAKLKAKKFVFSSTGGAMYGNNPSTYPTKEGEREVPESPYGIAKRSVELYLDFFRKTHGMKCISLRYSNVYGPRQNYLGEAGVVTIFMNLLRQGKKPTIFGTGKQTRDFVYVADVARANYAALVKNPKHNMINISTGKDISINNLAAHVLASMQSTTRINHGPARKGEVIHSCLHPGLAKKELGWKPTVSLTKGLAATAAWFAATKR